MKPLPKTWKQVCKIKGISEKLPFAVSKIPKAMRDYMAAAYKLPIIINLLNEGWKPNWNDSNEYKYSIWWKVQADGKRTSGFGLAFGGYDYWATGTAVGSRLSFKTRELAEYVGKQKEFIKLFQDLYLFK